jgi:CubicO group peptidase (beta-lactamase class C family)
MDVRDINDEVRAEVATMNLPGLSVAVGVDGRLVWAEGIGWADVENQVKVAPDTRFYIGTASKMPPPPPSACWWSKGS